MPRRRWADGYPPAGDALAERPCADLLASPFATASPSPASPSPWRLLPPQGTPHALRAPQFLTTRSGWVRMLPANAPPAIRRFGEAALLHPCCRVFSTLVAKQTESNSHLHNYKGELGNLQNYRGRPRCRNEIPRSLHCLPGDVFYKKNCMPWMAVACLSGLDNLYSYSVVLCTLCQLAGTLIGVLYDLSMDGEDELRAC
ncbi:hypothetical protein ACP70R_004925 [Stipagrostis hirtigluma subsp. patula]